MERPDQVFSVDLVHHDHGAFVSRFDCCCWLCAGQGSASQGTTDVDLEVF